MSIYAAAKIEGGNQISPLIDMPKTKREIADAVRKELYEHFMRLNAERHKGLTRRGFYEQAARSLESTDTPDGFEVSTERVGIGLRFFGGVVVPVKAQWLTIPAIAEAYGKSARDFGNLAFVKFRDDLAALKEKRPKSATVAATGKRVRNKFKMGNMQGAFKTRVFFWLKRSTQHDADETVMPTVDRLEEVAGQAAETAIERVIQS